MKNTFEAISLALILTVSSHAQEPTNAQEAKEMAEKAEKQAAVEKNT